MTSGVTVSTTPADGGLSPCAVTVDFPSCGGDPQEVSVVLLRAWSVSCEFPPDEMDSGAIDPRAPIATGADEAGADRNASRSHRCCALSSRNSACNLVNDGSVKSTLKNSRCLAFSIFTKHCRPPSLLFPDAPGLALRMAAGEVRKQLPSLPGSHSRCAPKLLRPLSSSSPDSRPPPCLRNSFWIQPWRRHWRPSPSRSSVGDPGCSGAP